MLLSTIQHPRSPVGLNAVGLTNLSEDTLIHWNLTPAELYEHALHNDEASLTRDGALRVLTGIYTGRSPKDKYFVREETSEDDIWWGDINQPVSQDVFNHMRDKVIEHLGDRDNLYVLDAFAGADEKYRMPIRVVSEAAYHALFAWNMFVRASEDELAQHEPEFTILAAPTLHADPAVDGTNSETFIGVDLAQKLIVIVGTLYSGEVKKGIFSVMNYKLPQEGVMPMHCSANTDMNGENTAIFFGLSGTGKTTLSADASRILIGDDEHAWSDDGVFNIEGGCYAKTINLSPEGEPEIYATTRMFGTILENIPLDDKRIPDFSSTEYTQNTRCSYPIHYIPNASATGVGGHPENVIFLTADAFGVLPPISKLTPEQAMYHFISGYTSKVAGTERGVTEPQPTFSACFGAPFMPLHPTAYAELLAEKIRAHGSHVWLINTGWNGQGDRMKLTWTRNMVDAVHNGDLNDVEFTQEDYFGLAIPTNVPGVPPEVLDPTTSWDNKAAYDERARHLVNLFNANFEAFADEASAAIINAGPQV